MHDQRFVRFASLGQLTEEDLQLAVDVWLEDALKSPWGTKDTMKLAGVLAHYILTPATESLNLKSLEDVYQLSADAARRALVLFELYGLIDAHSTHTNELRAALRLSQLQMLRVLKTKTELEQLAQTGQSPALTPAEERWRPGPSTRPAEDALASAAVSHVRDIEKPPLAAVAEYTAPAETLASELEARSAAPVEADDELNFNYAGFDASPHEAAAQRLPATASRVSGAEQNSRMASAVSGQDALARSLRRLQRRLPT
jgi:hypothetical protein